MSQLPIRRVGAATALAGLVIFASGSAIAAPVKLTLEQERALGVRTAPLAVAQSAPIAAVPGVFVRPPGGRSAVSAPFAGTVTQVNVIEGQAVRAGQALATVFSRDALSESAALRQARAEAALAAATAERTRKLVDEGVVAGSRAAEADARATAARAMLDAKATSVRLAGVAANGRFVLTAPFAGRVAHVGVNAGEGVEVMATAFIIDRQDRIQVDAVLPASLAGRVREGARVSVDGVDGKVIAVGVDIDPKTRSLSVRAEVPPRNNFIPGRSTRLEIYDAPAGGGLSIPRAAVTNLDGKSVVFVRNGQTFSPIPVNVLGYSGDKATISGAGLRAAAVVAISGVSELKAQAEGR